MEIPPINVSSVYGQEPLGDKPRPEERIFRHLGEIAYATNQMAAEHDEESRNAYKDEIQKIFTKVKDLISDLPSHTMIDAYACTERMEQEARTVFISHSNPTRVHQSLGSIGDAFRAFNNLLNWEKR
jgi:hypothetical protein